MTKVITVPDDGTFDEEGNPARAGMFYAHVPIEVETELAEVDPSTGRRTMTTTKVVSSPTNPDHKHDASSGTFVCDECGQMILDAQAASADNYKGFKVK